MQVVRRAMTTIVAGAALTSAAAGPAAAAVSKPGASTGAATQVTFQSATLRGAVNPHGAATTYSFQYGATAAYGGTTAPQSAGAGTTAKRVGAPVAGLAPATTYHVRIVATNAAGTTVGADRTLTTSRQPLALTVAATPNPVPFGSAATIGGTLAGTGGGNRQVVLQQRPFPYTGGFAQVGNPQLTSPAGAFSFPGVPIALTTQFRVLSPGRPTLTSPIVTTGVSVRVSTIVRKRRLRRGTLVRFSGLVRPSRDAAQVGVQRLTKDGRWVTFAGTIAHHASATASRYAKTVRIRHSGSYRIYVLVDDGRYVSGVGRTVKLTLR